MKDIAKLVMKIFLVLLFLVLSPLTSAWNLLSDQWFSHLITYPASTQFKFELSDAVNMLEIVYKEDIPMRETDIEPTPVPELPQDPIQKGSVYIYSTHQSEAYLDGKTVYDASLYLETLLEAEGFDVTVESMDFMQALKDQGLNYNESYLISRNALIDALVEHSGYDLIIDFHRDSLPRESTYIEANGKNYAKMMSVIGGLSEHADVIIQNAQLLFDNSNIAVDGIMKPALIREAYYNQDISENMLLIEVGSDQNTYDEVVNSVEVLASAITKMKVNHETLSY